MDHAYKYAILRASPDARRGECVNIGVIVFLPDRIDLRIPESRKAHILTGKSWDSYIQDYAEMLTASDNPEFDAEERITLLRNLQNEITMSDLGWFEARDAEQYHKSVHDILKALVVRPREPRDRAAPKINSEITRSFRSAKIMAGADDDLTSGKVIRDLVIDQDEGLSADFALRNGVLNIAATLDFRSSQPRKGQAALKAITLDKAARVFDGTEVKRLAVYAVAPVRQDEVREHISLLKDYSDETFNWSVRVDRQRFERVFFDAYNAHIDSK